MRSTRYVMIFFLKDELIKRIEVGEIRVLYEFAIVRYSSLDAGLVF